jgi:adenylyltransferase/sulfurtransferase
LLLGIGRPLVGRLVLLDALEARAREVELPRDPACALCGEHPTIFDVAPVAPDEQPPSNVPNIEARALDAFLAEHLGALVLDVREPHEAALGTLPGALSIPASQLEARLHELDSARTYVVACRLGARSDWAARRLKEAGFERLYHLNDGLLAYEAAGAAIDLF